MDAPPPEAQVRDSPDDVFSGAEAPDVKALSADERAKAEAILAQPAPKERRRPQRLKPTGKPRPKKKALANLPLRKACVDGRIAGLQYWQIAEEQGISAQAARHQVEQWILEQTPTEERTEELRQMMVQRLEILHHTYWKKATGYTSAKGVEHPPDDRAADLLLRVLDREAKVMGVELQPNTVQITVTAEAIASFLGWDDSAAATEIIDVVPSVRDQVNQAHAAIEAAKP